MEQPTDSMEITDINSYHIDYEMDAPFEPSWYPGFEQHVHKVQLYEVETDAGISGITSVTGDAARVDSLDLAREYLVGEDPRHIEQRLDDLDSLNSYGPRPWHFEIAFWDIKGKEVGKPIHELLGGDSEPIPAYASSGELRPVDERLEWVADRVDEGFEAIKLRFHSDDMGDDLAVARAVRDEYPDLTIMVDLNMGWSFAHPGGGTWTFDDALSVARELEDVGNIGWLEEPFNQLNYEALARLREKTDIPIAGGEFNNGVHQFREFVDHDALDVLQPDVMLSAGISKTKLIAGVAEMHGLQFAPHTWNDGIGFAANVQLLACTNPSWCEYPIEPPGWSLDTRDFLLEEPLTAEDGAVVPPTDPGLGIDLDWDLVDELAESTA
ncbi:mandelate racemase/muconate lactonizing enzyme family protein [Halorubellus sp. JP-L1]|uniref:mandelate racemase/muconate lactonizing enzyme family protein n=1 Tax=Halorubellus sp. JP-L1 TaxID=2715753 RepID=UPI00140E0604|nr:mandelate racemase/muconate lactonizing enzyme family protein [Halorubellus sp. JP-L1]NHN42939.1 mandelate racemase/muconate lactonizing enzyme family protein [Halorubellus sp. JP-L1]